MSEKDGEKHVFSYMDGIPVKISEKYKPPRKIVLPVGFQNRLLQPPVVPDYDFQLEHDVLNKLQQWRSSKAKEKEKRRERLAEADAKQQKVLETMQELEKTMNELSTDESQSKNQLSEPTVSSTVPVTVQEPSRTQSPLPPQQSVSTQVISLGNPILRPVPFKHQVVTSQINNNNNPLSAFNLSDFEADTSSPFDNMELKTINDLEELAQVLQPSTVSQVPNYYQNLIGTDEHFANMQHQTTNCQASSMEQPFNLPSSDKMLNDVKCGVSYQPHVNGFTSNYDYNSMQNYHPQTVIPHHNPHGHISTYHFIDRNHMPRPSEASFSYPQEHQQIPQQQQHSQNFYMYPSVSYQPTRLQEPSFKNVAVNESLSSSNPPMFNMLPSTSVDESSPDDASISCAAQQLSELMKSRASKNQPKPSEDSTPENSSSSVQSPTSPVEPDPFQSLHSESQFLVQKIAEMGFPRARVARACKNLGTNDKKIVEFLLSLQSLLDAGYQEGRAEHALSLLNHDVKAAVKFLQVESQLLDLGFPVDRVTEALVKFNCDRDQALEFLIS